MGKIVRLMANNIILTLKIVNEANWCRVYFENRENNSVIFLGADNLKIILFRMITALKREGFNEKKPYEHGDLVLFWILSLSEQHTSIYASLQHPHDIKIFCIEDDGHFLPEIHLIEKDIASWISILSRGLVA